MSFRSDAYFGVVDGDDLDDAVRKVRNSLEGFDRERYRVASLRVKKGERDNVVIVMVMASSDLDQADEEAEEAARAINEILRESPYSSHLRERQRELSLV